MTTHENQWEQFLDPDIVRPSLFMATMFITAFEILKNSIVDRIRGFYSNEWPALGVEESLQYKADVLSRHKNRVYASLNWLHENQVINDDDLIVFDQLKTTRNLLAHQLFDVVTGQTKSNHLDQFPVLVALLRKIEVWWVVNVEIATNSDYADAVVDEDGIVPGAMLSLQILMEVASGNKGLLEAWQKQRSKGVSEV